MKIRIQDIVQHWLSYPLFSKLTNVNCSCIDVDMTELNGIGGDDDGSDGNLTNNGEDEDELDEQNEEQNEQGGEDENDQGGEDENDESEEDSERDENDENDEDEDEQSDEDEDEEDEDEDDDDDDEIDDEEEEEQEDDARVTGRKRKFSEISTEPSFKVCFYYLKPAIIFNETLCLDFIDKMPSL